MTTWLVTTPVDGEGTFETDDDGILALANRIILNSDAVDDGEEYIIRKADYLRVKSVPQRERHLKLVWTA